MKPGDHFPIFTPHINSAKEAIPNPETQYPSYMVEYTGEIRKPKVGEWVIFNGTGLRIDKENNNTHPIGKVVYGEMRFHKLG